MGKAIPFTLQQAREWTRTLPTPFYIYDEAGIRRCVADLYKAFSWNPGYREYFAVKATPTPGVLRLLEECGCGTDCASISELELSRRSGISGERIVFSSNETLPEEYEAACRLGAIINLDDLTQVDRLKEAIEAASLPIPDKICCRYNPGSFQITGDIMGHLYDSKFGMPKDQLFAALSELKAWGIERFGIHAMLQSCSLDEIYYPVLAEELFELALEIREKLGITLSFIDLSGGIGIPYRPEEKPVDIFHIGEEVRKVYEKILVPAGMELSLYTEMGRYITGPYGCLLTRVVGKKHIYKEYLGLDASACDLMRPAMYGAYHHITILGKEESTDVRPIDVVGALCENNDKFAIDRLLPEAEIGDLVVIHDAGAHSRSMGYNYNGRLRCGEYMLHEDGTLSILRRGERLEDLFATFDVDPVFSGEDTSL